MITSISCPNCSGTGTLSTRAPHKATVIRPCNRCKETGILVTNSRTGRERNPYQHQARLDLGEAATDYAVNALATARYLALSHERQQELAMANAEALANFDEDEAKRNAA